MCHFDRTISTRKSEIISTSRRLYLRQKDLHETYNYGLGGEEDSGTGGKEAKERK